MLNHIKSNIDKFKPIFEEEHQSNYESEEMVNFLKLISQITGIIEKKSYQES